MRLYMKYHIAAVNAYGDLDDVEVDCHCEPTVNWYAIILFSVLFISDMFTEILLPRGQMISSRLAIYGKQHVDLVDKVVRLRSDGPTVWVTFCWSVSYTSIIAIGLMQTLLVRKSLKWV